MPPRTRIRRRAQKVVWRSAHRHALHGEELARRTPTY